MQLENLIQLTDPKEVEVWFSSDVEPKKTKGNVHAAITINNLGPVKKFLSDSSIMIIL
jgi:hypothetical protein